MSRLSDHQILLSLQSLPEDQSDGEGEDMETKCDSEEEIIPSETSSSSSDESNDYMPLATVQRQQSFRGRGRRRQVRGIRKMQATDNADEKYTNVTTNSGNVEKDILERANISPSFLTTFFLVPKVEGSFRPIFSLRQLNNFVRIKPFRLINHCRIPGFLQEKDWLVKLDLSRAYFHLNIAKEHRRFLRLSYKGELLQMTCLPFGLSSAPRIFANVINWIAEYLRHHNIRCVVYLDDFLLASQSPILLSDQIAFVVSILKQLGWSINFDKSVLIPTQRLEFLGVTWDTKLNTKTLSESKCLTLRRALQQQIARGSWSLKQAQSLLGRLNFASFVIL